jgi:hypothetical protein
MIVIESTISPVSTILSTCWNRVGRTWNTSVSSGSNGSAGLVRSKARNRWAVSSMTLLEVW